MTTERVALHPLTFVEDGDEVVVGRPDIESYAVFPPDGAELLRRLAGGSTLPEAAAWYEATYREPVDVDEFLDTLRELGFARELGSAPIAPPEIAGPAAPVRFQRLGQLLFSPASALPYAALVVAAALTAWQLPAVRPAPSGVFFTGSLVVVQLTLIFGELPLIFLHEGAHVLAGRRLGLTSKLGVGRRLYFVVFETTLTKLLSVPRRKRYLPLLAGVLTDGAVIALLVLFAAATRHTDGSLPVAGRFAVAMGYLTAIRILWQLLFFMETDAHHVLATALRVTDLHGMTGGYLRRFFWRALRRPSRAGAEPYLSDHDRAVLRWFGPLTLIASVGLTGLAFVATLPVLVGYLARVASGIAAGAADTDFWNVVLSLLFGVAQFGVLGLVAVRDRRAAARARGAAAARRASTDPIDLPG